MSEDIEEIAARISANGGLVAIRARAELTPCACSLCKYACTGLPGIYEPTDLLRELAPMSTVQRRDFLLSLTCDYLLGVKSKIGAKTVFFLRPRRTDEPPGELAPIAYSTGQGCVNNGPNGCMLPRNKMPLGCLTAYSCDTRHVGIIEVDKPAAALTWDTPSGHKVIAQYEKYAAERVIMTGTPARIGHDTLNRELQEINPLAGYVAMMQLNMSRQMHIAELRAEKARIESLCSACGASLSVAVRKRCSRCKCVFYCDTTCQTKHWPVHKSNC